MKLDSSIAAVVTGGASGLGEGTARALSALGVKVALFDLNAERGNAIAEEIGGCYFKVDVTSKADVEAGFASARAANGQERILVNCAGIVAAAKTVGRKRDSGEITGFPLDLLEKVLSINLVGTYRCVVESACGMVTLPALPGGERGVIVNTSSVAATDGQIGQVAYSASKAGVMGMTLPIARDLAAEGIRINAILPGIFQTPMLTGLPQETQQSLAATIPFPSRFGAPADYANLVLAICTNDYLNGESIRLDGAVRLTPR